MRLLAKSLNLESKIKSGYYDINVDMSVAGLLNHFTSAKVATRRLLKKDDTDVFAST
jgi:cell division protein YceG involved in septum cleavage